MKAAPRVGSADIAATTMNATGPTFTYTFPPYSATVLSIDGGFRRTPVPEPTARDPVRPRWPRPGRPGQDISHPGVPGLLSWPP